jgi:poly-gamma-glutamate synthesis protein (capsule biosynthesis protein)
MKLNIKKNDGIIKLNGGKTIANIAFSGDLCPLNGYEKPFSNGSLESLMPEVIKELREADAHIINMEAPITEKGKAILKCGPNFRANPKCVNGLKQLNATHACLANNHIKDFGEEGIKDSIDYLEKAKIKAIGIVKGEKEVMEPYIFRKNKLRIAIINVAEAEFSYPTKSSLGTSFLNEVKVLKKIEKAAKKADIVIVTPHAGREYKFFPACWLRETYKNFIDAGADAVIAHHPHVPQGIEIYNKGVIFYSLGNFIFDRTGMHEKLGPDTSFFVKCSFAKNGITDFRIYPYKRNNDNSISLLTGKKREYFMKFMDAISEPLSNEENSKSIWDEYVRGDMELYLTWLKKCISDQPFKKTKESQSHLAYLFSVLSMSQTHKKMIECVFRLLIDDNVKTDKNTAKLIKSWESLMGKIQR